MKHSNYKWYTKRNVMFILLEFFLIFCYKSHMNRILIISKLSCCKHGGRRSYIKIIHFVEPHLALRHVCYQKSVSYRTENDLKIFTAAVYVNRLHYNLLKRIVVKSKNRMCMSYSCTFCFLAETLLLSISIHCQ